MISRCSEARDWTTNRDEMDATTAGYRRMPATSIDATRTKFSVGTTDRSLIKASKLFSPNAQTVAIGHVMDGVQCETDGERDAPNYFLAVDNSACQLRITVIGGGTASSVGTSARKRCPSGMTS
jgi:hypothetical protein